MVGPAPSLAAGIRVGRDQDRQCLELCICVYIHLYLHGYIPIDVYTYTCMCVYNYGGGFFPLSYQLPSFAGISWTLDAATAA